MNDENTSYDTPTGPRRILIAADLSEASKRALQFAQHIASPHADVRIVSVAENPRTLVPTGSLSSSFLDEARDELLRDATDAVNQARERFAHDDVHLDTEVVELAKHGGDATHALLDCASTWHADLLIVGAREHHGWLSRWVNGTVSEPLVKLSHCPILVVPAPGENRAHRAPERVLFALDGSDLALRALRFGLTLASSKAELRAIYVVDRAAQLADTVPLDALEDAFVKQGEQALAAAKPELERVGADDVTTEVISTAWSHDDVAYVILREAQTWQADLIVITLASKAGHYLSDVDVSITSGQHVALAVRTEGPFLFVRVPAGRYRIAARDRHVTETKEVAVPSRGAIDVHFYWADPDRHGVMLLCRSCPNRTPQ